MLKVTTRQDIVSHKDQPLKNMSRQEWQGAHPVAEKMVLSRSKISLALTVLVILLLSGLSILFFQRDKAGHTGGGNAASVVNQVGRHFVLPQDEQPVIATVTDQTKLTSPVLKLAENDDKLLVYQKTKIAILYRPRIDKIITVSPVSFDEPPPQLKN